MKIRLKNGLQIENGEIVVSADATKHEDSDIGLISHAHADHIPSGVKNGLYVCSDKTYKLAKSRKRSYDYTDEHDNITQYDAGHIPGSRCFLVEGEKDILYTGDFSVRDRMHIDGFNPPSADILITESTYGHPRYQFDSQSRLESKIVSWFKKKRGERVVCKGYSLGRAQEIEILARRAGFKNIIVNKATMKMNSLLSTADREFSTSLYEDEFPEDTILITSNRQHILSLLDQENTSTANFTGWAHDGRYQSSDIYDRSFVLTDHADFSELIETVREVDPETVYTLHGYTDKLANEIRSRIGVESRSLRNNQTTIQDFQ